MDSSIITELIGQLQKTGELSSTAKSKILEVLRSYEERNLRDNLIKSLTDISKGMISTIDWDELLNESFIKLGSGIRADRVCYYENVNSSDSDTRGFEIKVEWCSDYAKQEFGSSNYQVLPEDSFLDLFTVLNNRCPFQSTRSAQMEGKLKTLMADDGIKTILLLPIHLSDELFGFIRIDSCKSDRHWSEREISLLQPIVFQVRNLLEKRDVELQIQKTYRQAQVGIWEIDLVKDTLSWSPVTREIFGLQEDEYPTMEMVEESFADEESKAELMRLVERARQTGESYDMELPVKTVNGNVKWIRDTGQAEFKNGRCVRLYGLVQDIHKRKIAELESEKNKKLLQAITQQTDVAVWVRDKQGKIIFVNDEWKRIFNLDNQDINDLTLFDLFGKEVARDMVSSDQKVLANNRQVVFEEQIETGSGSRYYMVNKFPLKGIAGLEDAVGGIGTDITEIKQTEEKLQKTEQKLLEIIEHSTNLFYTHNTDHELTYLSPQSIDFLGYKPEDAKRRWTEFVTDHPVNTEGGKSTQRAIDTGVAQPPFELQLKRGDGKIIWVEVNEAPVVKNGKTISIAGSLTDITERKKAQESIRSNLKEKETLLAEIHHRVKNNLAVVASLMQLQAMESDSPELQDELIESVLRIKSMASIHEHLYKAEIFSKLDLAGNLKSLVRDVIDTMQYSSDISLKFDCDEVYLNINQAIPCSLILNEVITNIIKHAFKELEKGEISLQLHQDEKDMVAIKVQDNGRGLPEGFDQNELSTLGMQLIKTLSAQLSAEYRYESLEKGTEFTLRFARH